MMFASMPRNPCARSLGTLLVAVLGLAIAAGASGQESRLDLEARSEPRESQVDLGKMTYVSSRGTTNEMIVDAETARILPDEEVAHLRDVHIRMAAAQGGDGGLDMTCDEGRFDFETGDFIATGNVRGRTTNGRRFETTVVRYSHETSLVTTDVPVLIRDDAGTYRGGGFDYYLEEDRFRIRGGASVVQE